MIKEVCQTQEICIESFETSVKDQTLSNSKTLNQNSNITLLSYKAMFSSLSNTQNCNVHDAEISRRDFSLLDRDLSEAFKMIVEMFIKMSIEMSIKINAKMRMKMSAQI